MFTNSRRAFTLIEAMVTVLIITTASIGAVEMVLFVRNQSTLEQERSRATQIVCREMERIRHELYTRITGGSQELIWDNGTPDDATDDTVGTIEVTVNDPEGNVITAAPKPSVAVRVEVTLTWHPRGRRQGSTFRESAMTWIAPS